MCVCVYFLSANFLQATRDGASFSLNSTYTTMAGSRGPQPHADGPTRFFFSASLPALPKVSRDRWRQTLPLTVSVLGFNVLQVLLLITLVSSHLRMPHCRYYLLLTA